MSSEVQVPGSEGAREREDCADSTTEQSVAERVVRSEPRRDPGAENAKERAIYGCNRELRRSHGLAQAGEESDLVHEYVSGNGKHDSHREAGQKSEDASAELALGCGGPNYAVGHSEILRKEMKTSA